MGIEKFLNVPLPDVQYNAKIKNYKDGQQNIIYSKEPIFKPADWEYQKKCLKNGDGILSWLDEIEKKKNPDNDPRLDSLKRAKDNIFDIVINNDFNYFFTGTLDPKEIDSKDPKEVMKRVNKWLQNQTARNDLQYLLVAERHKKGGIHFHGVMRGQTKLASSGTRKYKGFKKPLKDDTALRMGLDLSEGHEVFNLPSWRFGFTTCINCYGDKTAIAFYITKYLTKDCKKIFGSFYWHSRGLDKPLLTYDNVNYEAIDSFEFNGFKYEFKG